MIECTTVAGDHAGLRVCFLRAAYGVGAHYNSVRAVADDDEHGEAEDSVDL